MEIRLNRAENIDIRVTAPPSKSFTHRALVAAGLADGESVISRPLSSTDTLVTSTGLWRMGVGLEWEEDRVTIAGSGGKLECGQFPELDMGDSGTSFRLLTSVALLCSSPVLLTGSRRMKERPVGALVDALNQLGGRIRYLEKTGYPPILVDGTLSGGFVSVDSKVSSQFASSILLAAPCADAPVELQIPPGAVSRSYLDITTDVMAQFGAVLSRDGYQRYRVEPVPYQPRSYRVEGDYSSASYFFAMAAVCGGRVEVENLSPRSVQGDRLFLDALEHMGCTVTWSGNRVVLASDRELSGIEIDMSAAPDTVQTLCMVAAFAKTPTRITGIAHLKFKESDRIAAILKILRSLGGDVTLERDGAIVIRPALLHGGVIDPGNDHRTAMSGAVLALGIGEVTITGAECVSKSFPGFWEILSKEGLA
jgi:3-phosphoshikimate 1-carboxyvinyltransferase